jgi:multicomponent Na+:H+ antiporter subunit E
MVMWSRRWAVFAWCYLVWLLLTWTATVEQVLVGAVLSAIVTLASAPLGNLSGPWRGMSPRRAFAVARLIGLVATRVVVANIRLARLVWSRSPEPPSGMVIVETEERSDGGLTAVALFTSVVVDSQLVDLDRERGELHYHAVWASDDRETNHRRINAPIEDALKGIIR